MLHQEGIAALEQRGGGMSVWDVFKAPCGKSLILSHVGDSAASSTGWTGYLPAYLRFCE